MGSFTTSNHYVCTILHNLRDQTALREQLLDEVGLPLSLLDRDTHRRVAIDAYADLHRRITRLTDDESFGFLPLPLKSGIFGMACEYAAIAPTIGEALERLARFYNLTTDCMKLNLSVHEHEAVFQVELSEPEHDRFHFIAENFLNIAYRFSSWLAGREVHLRRAGLAFPEPSHADEYTYNLRCKCQFDCGRYNYIAFDPEYLNLPVLKMQSDLETFVERAPRDLLDKFFDCDSLANRVYLAISQKGEEENPNAATVACDLAMAEQTLRRRLRAEGVTFQKIKDKLRQDTAVFHLANGQYTIAEISDKLRFSAPSAFSRAFKNWTGMSPEEYRNGGGQAIVPNNDDRRLHTPGDCGSKELDRVA